MSVFSVYLMRANHHFGCPKHHTSQEMTLPKTWKFPQTVSRIICFYWVAYGKPSRGLRLVCLYYFFYYFLLFFCFLFFRVGKSLACHSPGKWCLCA